MRYQIYNIHGSFNMFSMSPILMYSICAMAKIAGIKSLNEAEMLTENSDTWRDTLQGLCDILQQRKDVRSELYYLIDNS